MRKRQIRPQCLNGNLQVVVPRNLPVAALIDTSSASAAELTALALQVAQRAVVIGSRSFGKGSAYRTFPLTERTLIGGMLIVTTAIYRVFGDVTPQLTGVETDESLADARAERLVEVLRGLKPGLVFQEKDYGTAVLQVPRQGKEPRVPHDGGEFRATIQRLAIASRAHRSNCVWEEQDCSRHWAEELLPQLAAATKAGEVAWDQAQRAPTP